MQRFQSFSDTNLRSHTKTLLLDPLLELAQATRNTIQQLPDTDTGLLNVLAQRRGTHNPIIGLINGVRKLFGYEPLKWSAGYHHLVRPLHQISAHFYAKQDQEKASKQADIAHQNAAREQAQRESREKREAMRQKVRDKYGLTGSDRGSQPSQKG